MSPDPIHKPPQEVKSTPMRPDDPFLKSGAALKVGALLASRVLQFNSYSCSAAALTVVINAIRRLVAGGPVSQSLTQKEVLAMVDLHHWRERVSDSGYRGMHGMPLFEFGEVVREALRAYRIPLRRVDSIGIHPDMADLESLRRELKRVLEIVAESPNDFLIAHFTQGAYFGNWHGGHISPVGAYDPNGERVLILDVDPDCEFPYWVSFDRFFEGLVGRSKVIGSRGGGYVRIELESFESGRV